MAQQLGAHTALPGGQSSTPRTHSQGLTSACDSSYRGSKTSGSRMHLLSRAHTHTETHNQKRFLKRMNQSTLTFKMGQKGPEV